MGCKSWEKEQPAFQNSEMQTLCRLPLRRAPEAPAGFSVHRGESQASSLWGSCPRAAHCGRPGNLERTIEGQWELRSCLRGLKIQKPPDQAPAAGERLFQAPSPCPSPCLCPSLPSSAQWPLADHPLDVGVEKWLRRGGCPSGHLSAWWGIEHGSPHAQPEEKAACGGPIVQHMSLRVVERGRSSLGSQSGCFSTSLPRMSAAAMFLLDGQRMAWYRWCSPHLSQTPGSCGASALAGRSLLRLKSTRPYPQTAHRLVEDRRSQITNKHNNRVKGKALWKQREGEAEPGAESVEKWRAHQTSGK